MNVTVCDRCGKRADPEMLDGWIVLQVGVRGTNDASNRLNVRDGKDICPACDDELYDWFWRKATP